MAIWITGAAGFIGSRLVERCNNRKTEVVSVDHLPYFTSRAHLRELSLGQLIDISESTTRLSGLPKPEAILHIGACSDTTETRPEVFRELNTGPSEWYWNYATENQIPLVYASSAATYGDGNQGYQDTTPLAQLHPLNLYGQSKQDFDLFAEKQSTLKLAPPRWLGLKFFNVYGFHEQHKGAMASVVTKAYSEIRETGALKLFRSDRPEIPDGGQRRDFVFIDDIINLIFHWLDEKKLPNGLYNAGTGTARSFLDLGHACFRALGKNPKIHWVDMPSHLKGKYQYFTEADMSRVAEQLRFTKCTTLELGVETSIKRYQMYDQKTSNR